jgi:hypothetical protein
MMGSNWVLCINGKPIIGDRCAMMAERNVDVTHTTIMRWVHRFVPELERRWARFAKPSGSSWRMDETTISDLIPQFFCAPLLLRGRRARRAVVRYARKISFGHSL